MQMAGIGEASLAGDRLDRQVLLARSRRPEGRQTPPPLTGPVYQLRDSTTRGIADSPALQWQP